MMYHQQQRMMILFTILSMAKICHFQTQGDQQQQRMKEEDLVVIRTPPKAQGVHQEIFANYTSQVMPDGDANNTVHISIDVAVLKLSYLRWFDRRLQWNPSDHHNISRLTVPNTMVWLPDIVLYNDAANAYSKIADIYRTNVQIASNGLLTWTSTIEWKANCEVDVTWFPIDKQVCNMIFGSLSYTDDQLVLTVREKPKDIAAFVKRTDLNFVQSGEWQVNGIAVTQLMQSFPCCRDEFSAVAYTVTLSRFPQFYFLYIFFPIVSQFFLFLMVFHIRSESGERLGFGITILLNITMFMTFISTKLPEKSNNRPFIGVIFSSLFFVYSFALALASVTTFFATRTTPVPRWLHRLAPAAKRFSNNKKLSSSSTSPTEEFFRENRCAVKATDEIEFSTLKESAKGNNNNTLKNIPNGDDGEITWSVVMRSIDKYMFYFFLAISLLIPVLVALFLNKNFLGAW